MISNKNNEEKRLKEPINYFSMFSGIGGFELGLQNSKYDFKNVGFSEVDKYAISIYSRHFPNHRNYGDATRINTKELEDFELLVGGFPCQAFSIAGRREGFNDCRGTLFFELARVLRDKHPRYFLFENVKNLLSHEGGRTIQTIFRVCDELGYDVSWKIYNSKHYGVPQNRERIFIKGYFRDKCSKQVLSQTQQNKKIDAELIQLNNHKKTHQDERVYDINGLGMSLNARGNNGFYKTGKEYFHIRRLTPTECERLQGFPDDWTKYGKSNEIISDTQRYKCLGNAVTTNVITAIVNEMFNGE